MNKPAEKSDPYRTIARYFPWMNAVLNWFLRQMQTDLLYVLREKDLSRVLDLGCGTGELARFLANAGCNSVCLDLSAAMLAQASAKAGMRPGYSLVRADGGHLPFKPSFDAAVMRFVFHEMDPTLREAVWEEIHRILLPAGLLIFIDFSLPENAGIYGRAGRLLIRNIEYQMNRIHPPHYNNYMHLMQNGGIVSWVREHSGNIFRQYSYAGGNLAMIAVHKK
ncbi:MAG: class I SAM-dependent methyltransferase [Syntrophales bacterium]